MLSLFTIQYFYMAGLSCFGAVIFFIRKPRISIALFSIFLFCIAWRSFSFYTSPRYYTVFILYGLFFSAYAIKYLIGSFRKRSVQNGVFLVLLAALLGCHTAKMFSSFRNNYIFDLQDDIKRATADRHDDVVYIHSKELIRLKGGNLDTYGQLRLLSNDDDYDINEIFFKDCHYTNNVFFVVPEKIDSPATSPGNTEFKASILCRSKIEHHITNAKHTKSVSVYKFRFYSLPTPEVDLSTVYDNPVFKAYVPEYDAFIYQVKDKLVWLIGADFDRKTEIIYHQLTDRPDLLPADRIEAGFDNRGFRFGDKSERERTGRYRVFEKDIPTEYPITAIRAGFNVDGIKYWRIFCLNPY